ncbi:MAG: hypothetical protein KJP03_01455, partial [Gammaproteobacteria bacterium]|nr:hypothetical protein [Gammaproteobacteria bacterium]
MRDEYLLRFFAVIALACLFPNTVTAQPAESGQIRSFLEGIDAGDTAEIAGRRLNEPGLLSQVYRSREHAPIWLRTAPLEKEATDMLTAISQSVGHGFSADRYHRSAIEKLINASDTASRVALDLLLTDAFLGQALHRGRGAVYPSNLDAEWQVPQAEVDAAGLLLETAARRRAVVRVLDALWPAAEEYYRLLERRAEIAASGDEVTVQVSPGPLLKPGQTNDRVI